MSDQMPGQVRVRCETPMLGLAWGEVAELTRTGLVESAIASGRLTVLETEIPTPPQTPEAPVESVEAEEPAAKTRPSRRRKAAE
jgi:hypothetical protein